MTQNKIYVLLNIVDGETSLWTLPEILEEINRDRSDEWTPYDESDWREGLDEFTNFQLLAEVDRERHLFRVDRGRWQMFNVKRNGQGLLNVYHGDKQTEWKISNNGGRWKLYCVLNNQTHEHPFDFAPLIHHPEKLSDKLGEILKGDSDD